MNVNLKEGMLNAIARTSQESNVGFLSRIDRKIYVLAVFCLATFALVSWTIYRLFVAKQQQEKPGTEEKPIKHNPGGQALNIPPVDHEKVNKDMEQLCSIIKKVYLTKDEFGGTDLEQIKKGMLEIQRVIRLCAEGSAYKGERYMNSAFREIEEDLKANEKGQIDLQKHFQHLKSLQQLIKGYATAALGNNQHQEVQIEIAPGLEETITYGDWYENVLNSFYSKIDNRKNRIVEAIRAANLEKYLPVEEPSKDQTVGEINEDADALMDREEPDSKGYLILQTFSQEELNQLKQKSEAPYSPLILAKNKWQAEGCVSDLPTPLANIDEQFVPEFRFARQLDPFTDTEAWINQCHRSWGTNTETLVRLNGTQLCYPANKVVIGKSHYIQSEAPRSEVFGSKAHYYQMAIEAGTELLVAVSTGFRRTEDKKSGQWTVTPHPETMDFLQPGESLEIHVPGGAHYVVECSPDEALHPLPDEIRLQAGIEGPCHYHIRELKITSDHEKEPRVIRQIVPDFISVGLPFSLSQYTVDFITSQSKSVATPDHPLIVNCNTGRDRSGQFIILDSMKREIQDLIDLDTWPIDQMLSAMDVVDQLRARAFMLASQSTEGSGVDSIEKTLLPCFHDEIPSAERKFYNAVSKEERNKLHQDINQTYRAWVLEKK